MIKVIYFYTKGNTFRLSSDAESDPQALRVLL